MRFWCLKTCWPRFESTVKTVIVFFANGRRLNPKPDIAANDTKQKKAKRAVPTSFENNNNV